MSGPGVCSILGGEEDKRPRDIDHGNLWKGQSPEHQIQIQHTEDPPSAIIAMPAKKQFVQPVVKQITEQEDITCLCSLN